ncbi:hypothetical protein ABIF78_007734 [Bradyrhizobium japonicum]
MLTADGCQDVAMLDDPSCCPPPLCGNDLCCTFVAFFNLLPTGPLWDYWKQAAISYFQHNEDPAQCPLVADPRCPSLILHAIYTVLKLRHMVHGPLWVAYRESNVYTAVTTLDWHLERLQWEDCYNQHCRSPSLGELTPLEIMGECGPLFCDPHYPLELESAVKRAVAIALTRANMGVIKNLCGINWIIEPLGARLEAVIPPPPCVDPPDEFDHPEGCVDEPEPPCEICDPDDVCKDMAFSLCYYQDWIEGVGDGDVCHTLTPRPKIPAYWDWGCDKPAGLPDRVWPGVLAAECIIRSLMPYRCPAIPITRCC